MVNPGAFSSRRGFIKTAGAAARGVTAWPRDLILAGDRPDQRPAAELETVRLDCTPQAYPALSIRGDDFSRYTNGRSCQRQGFEEIVT